MSIRPKDWVTWLNTLEMRAAWQLCLRLVFYVAAYRQEVQITWSFLLLFLWSGKPLSKLLCANIAALKTRSLSLSLLLMAGNQTDALQGCDLHWNLGGAWLLISQSVLIDVSLHQGHSACPSKRCEWVCSRLCGKVVSCGSDWGKAVWPYLTCGGYWWRLLTTVQPNLLLRDPDPQYSLSDWQWW